MRACGILMPVFSLPGPFGIGTLGEEAFSFVDFLARAKQTYWQILPIGPTGYGDSPYQSFSAFAGNPYFIDFRVLHEQGYLTADEIPAEVPVGPVDYGVLYQQRPVVLQKAADRLLAAASVEYKDFCTAQSFWLDDYALFMAIKAEQGQAGLCDWPDDLRTRQPAAVAAARERLAGQVDYFKAVQFFFYTQWNALKAYANGKGIQLVGDIPIYVSPDSSDLWTRPELFQTDGQTHLTQVAGCPRMPLRQTVSSGAIRSTTGPATRPRILPGGSAGCSTLLPFMMSCASTTSVVLRATTPSLPETRRRQAATGKRGRIVLSSMPSTRLWARAASLRRIWDT